MKARSPRFRLLVLVLAMHLAHVPIPMWDAGDGLQASGATAAGRVAGLWCWDLDLLLLGIDPPENLDEGPVDSDPESPHAQLFSLERAGSRPGCVQSGEADPSETLSATPAGRDSMISPAARLPALRLTCYSASFAGSHPWRTLLRVLTV